MPKDKVLDLAEVARHASKQDLYIVYESKVYNVTPFLHEHPGGEEVVLQVAGKDATGTFDDVGHSADAKDQLAELLIGALDSASAAKATALRSKKTVQRQGLNSTMLYGLVGAAAALAFGAYRYVYAFW